MPLFRGVLYKSRSKEIENICDRAFFSKILDLHQSATKENQDLITDASLWICQIFSKNQLCRIFVNYYLWYLIKLVDSTVLSNICLFFFKVILYICSGFQFYRSFLNLKRVSIEYIYWVFIYKACPWSFPSNICLFWPFTMVNRLAYIVSPEPYCDKKN